jgi:predicted HTH transcriptional regulator
MDDDKLEVELPEVEEEEEEVEETDLERLKRLILETEDCRISELRKITKMNMNKLNEYMKELVRDGFLLQPETRQSGYKINPNFEKDTPI